MHRLANFDRQSVLKSVLTVLLCTITLCAQAFTIVIDPGHGGHDPGAVGKITKEKNINLKVALKVGEYVKQNYPNIKVIYTRKTDVFIPLQNRAEIANKAKADLFISIHTNALKSRKQISGAETYSLGMARAEENLEVAKRENAVILYEKDNKERYAGFNPNSSESYIIFDFMQDQFMKQSAELANCIQKQYVATAHRTNRGVHQAGFLVLRETSMPSVLTELGYITTSSDESYLNSANGVNAMALSIYNGFANYYKMHHGGGKGAISLPSSEENATKKEKVEKPTPVAEASSQKQETSTVKTDENRPAVVGEKLVDEVAVPQKTEETTQEVERVQKEKVNTETNEESKNEVKKDVPVQAVFKIQIATSDRLLKAGNSAFKGLSPIEHYLDNKIYKYTYGSTTSYKEILALKRNINSKFPDCFVIAFRGEEKISIQEARNGAK